MSLREVPEEITYDVSDSKVIRDLKFPKNQTPSGNVLYSWMFSLQDVFYPYVIYTTFPYYPFFVSSVLRWSQDGIEDGEVYKKKVTRKRIQKLEILRGKERDEGKCRFEGEERK